ncbi:hypothetical protein TcWFU_009147 [Taenia crassiceps]|uniref:Uncharacterized protein n=1 Tax=Taenia crassiceps TaxID=6207 RepID=A0ABR4QF38_9CEST
MNVWTEERSASHNELSVAMSTKFTEDDHHGSSTSLEVKLMRFQEDIWSSTSGYGDMESFWANRRQPHKCFCCESVGGRRDADSRALDHARGDELTSE